MALLGWCPPFDCGCCKFRWKHKNRQILRYCFQRSMLICDISLTCIILYPLGHRLVLFQSVLQFLCGFYIGTLHIAIDVLFHVKTVTGVHLTNSFAIVFFQIPETRPDFREILQCLNEVRDYEDWFSCCSRRVVSWQLFCAAAVLCDSVAVSYLLYFWRFCWIFRSGIKIRLFIIVV